MRQTEIADGVELFTIIMYLADGSVAAYDLIIGADLKKTIVPCDLGLLYKREVCL